MITREELIKRYRGDFEAFCAECLEIKYLKPRGGKMFGAFEWNKAQRELKKEIDLQNSEQGYVRLVVLKGRKLGCSTFVDAYAYWKTIFGSYHQSFIFAHKGQTSDSLFQQVLNFYKQTPKIIRPSADKESFSELHFPDIYSGVIYGTAGGQEIGRGMSNTSFLHWSETAFTEKADQHASGILQAVPDAKGTVVILESTAKGNSGYFYESYQKGLANEQHDWKSVFLPWYWSDEWTLPLKKEFVPSSEPEIKGILSEEQCLKHYAGDGLTFEHLNWRRSKISGDFNGNAARFAQEFPFNPSEAFLTADETSYIMASDLQAAFDTEAGDVPTYESEARIGGIDPSSAQHHTDEAICVIRRGRTIEKIEAVQAGGTDRLASTFLEWMFDNKLDVCFFDRGHIGLMIGEQMLQRGAGTRLRLIDFSGRPTNTERYGNKRAEMYDRWSQWLKDRPCRIVSTEKDRAMLHSEIRYVKDRGLPKLFITEKRVIRKALGRSTDRSDAICLTFAEPWRHKQTYGKPAFSYDFNPWGF